MDELRAENARLRAENARSRVILTELLGANYDWLLETERATSTICDKMNAWPSQNILKLGGIAQAIGTLDFKRLPRSRVFTMIYNIVDRDNTLLLEFIFRSGVCLSDADYRGLCERAISIFHLHALQFFALLPELDPNMILGAEPLLFHLIKPPSRYWNDLNDRSKAFYQFLNDRTPALDVDVEDRDGKTLEELATDEYKDDWPMLNDFIFAQHRNSLHRQQVVLQIQNSIDVPPEIISIVATFVKPRPTPPHVRERTKQLLTERIAQLKQLNEERECEQALRIISS